MTASPKNGRARHARTLRATLGLAIAALAVTAAILIAGLIALADYLHGVTADLATSADSMRLASEAQTELIIHASARDHLGEAELEMDLESRLNRLEKDAATEHERSLLAEARAATRLSIAAWKATGTPGSEAQLRHAILDLDSLKQAYAVRVQAAQRRAAESHHWVDTSAVVLGLLLVSLVSGLLYWIRGSLVAPMLALANAAEEFGRGNREARAPEQGPYEMRHTARQFNSMTEALARQHQAQMTFTAGVAHDLRNPLLALRMVMSVFRPDHPLPSEERVRHALGLVQGQIAELERMIGDFLDIARIEAGRLKLQHVLIDGRQLVREAADLFAAASEKHTLRVTAPEQDVPLWCDPGRVRQVLANLISNAIKYSPRGGPVDIRIERAESMAIISVADRGIGIPEADRAKLFEPFRRVGLSAESIPGVGLGLFVVRRIVEAHGGSIDFESTPGEGSDFHVRLPLATEKPAS